jgi:hypothetical protein
MPSFFTPLRGRIYNPIMQLSEQDRCVPWQG